MQIFRIKWTTCFSVQYFTLNANYTKVFIERQYSLSVFASTQTNDFSLILHECTWVRSNCISFSDYRSFRLKQDLKRVLRLSLIKMLYLEELFCFENKFKVSYYFVYYCHNYVIWQFLLLFILSNYLTVAVELSCYL